MFCSLLYKDSASSFYDCYSKEVICCIYGREYHIIRLHPTILMRSFKELFKIQNLISNSSVFTSYLFKIVLQYANLSNNHVKKSVAKSNVIPGKLFELSAFFYILVCL